MTNTGKPGDAENTEPDGPTQGPSAADSTEDTSPRLSIPPNLWDTGLFKPAWTRPSSSRTSDSPPSAGSLLSRPEDLDPTPEPEEQKGGIDPDLVVPPALATFATGTMPAVPAVAPEPGTVVETPAESLAEPAVEPAEQTEQAEQPTEVRVVPPVIAPIPETPALDADAPEATEPEQDSEPDQESEPEQDSGDETALALSPIAAAAAAAGVTDEPEPAPETEPTNEPDEPEVEPDSETEAELDDEPDNEPDNGPDDGATQLVPSQPGPPDETRVAPRVVAPRTEETATQTSPATATALAPTAATTVVPPVPAGSGDGVTETGTTAVTVDDAPARRGKGLTIVLTIVVVAALIGGGWFLWQRSQDGPVREAFGESHGAFVSAASRLVTAESLDDVAAAGAGFTEATELLQDTRSAAGGRTSSLSTSVRRAVAAELEVAEAAGQLTALADGGFEAWGAARGDLESGLEALAGVHDDIVAAGGSTEDLPTADVVAETDAMVAQAARRVARTRTARATTDLGSAELLADLRGIGRRSGNGATQVTAAVDSLNSSDIDLTGVEAQRDVLDALGRLTRLKPATLNEWEPIRTRVERAAQGLGDEEAAALTSALAQAGTLVTKAAEAWAEWQDESEGARTAQAEDLEAVQSARTELDTLLQELETLDGDLSAYLSAGTAAEGGPDSEVRTTLVEAADARDGLLTRVYGLAMPEELTEETDAIEAALATHAATVRGAADTALTCVIGCRVPDTTAWQTLVAERPGQVTAIRDAVQAWRDAAQGAVQEIRQRELPEKPEI